MNNKNLLFILLLIILIIGAWLRLAGIMANSFAFTYDVGRDLLEVKKIVVQHKLTLIGQTTGLPGLFYGPWWYYILTIPFFLSNGNPQGIAIFIALTGIFSIFLAFLIGRKIDGDFLGLTFASLTSFSLHMVGLSSQIWNPNMTPFAIMLLLLLVGHIFRLNFKAHNFSLVALGLLLGFIIDFQVVFGLLFCLGTIISVVVILKKKAFSFRFLFVFLGLFFVFLPRIIFEFRHNFIMTKTIIANLANNPSSLFIPTTEIILKKLDFFNSLFANTLTLGNKDLSLAITLFSVALCVSSYRQLSKTEKAFLKMIAVVFSVFFLGLLFFTHDLFDHYVVGLPVLYLLFFSLSLNIVKNYHKKLMVSTVILIILLLINLKPLTIMESFKEPLWEGNAAVYRNQLAVIDYIYQKANHENFNFIVYTPPVHGYTYQYLFSWYGRNKYGYEPNEKKANLMFVIIEPDNQPNRIKEWLAVREKDGKIIDQKKVQGGITVQTRVR